MALLLVLLVVVLTLVLREVLELVLRAAVDFVLRAARERVRLVVLVFDLGEAEELRLLLLRDGLRVDVRLEVLRFALGERLRRRGLRLIMFLSPYVRT